jgi:hypothetical protein
MRPTALPRCWHLPPDSDRLGLRLIPGRGSMFRSAYCRRLVAATVSQLPKPMLSRPAV